MRFFVTTQSQIWFVYTLNSAYYLKNQLDHRLYHNVTDQIFNELNVLKHYLIFIIGGLLILWATGCDSPSSSADTEKTVLSSLLITPNLVQFGPQSLIGDTTFTIDIRATTLENPSGDITIGWGSLSRLS